MHDRPDLLLGRTPSSGGATPPIRRPRRRLLLTALALLLAVVTPVVARIGVRHELIALGAQAYLFGYPLVIFDATRLRSAARAGPENTLFRMRRFPDAAFRDVVRPNVDTLYTSAFIDTDRGPCVFEMPAQGERYEVMTFLDAWTNVVTAPGTRTQGQTGGRYLLAGPRWQGDPPAGVGLIRSPTRWLWLIGRTQTQGAADYATVHRLQDALSLSCAGTPRSAAARWLGPPPATTAASPREEVEGLSTPDFLGHLAALLPDNPPAPDDAPLMQRLAAIGLRPSEAPAWSIWDQAALGLGRHLAAWRITRALAAPTGLQQGWSTPPANLGRYGTDYNTRAAVAMIGLGANLPEDALYPSARLDAQGQPLEGGHRYQLHFAAGQLPPVRAFWSVTAYGDDEFFIDHPQRRYALGDRDPLVFNADGSLDLWVQADEPPPERRANWLPVRAGQRFQLMARLYWPRDEALRGDWRMPGLQRLD